MADYKIAVIPGDGVGLEVIDEGRKALEAFPDADAVYHFRLLGGGVQQVDVRSD